MIYFNASKPPFDNKLVRQALAWCVNREEIVNVAFFGQAEQATEAIPLLEMLIDDHARQYAEPRRDLRHAVLRGRA